jgi:hypothetical protein
MTEPNVKIDDKQQLQQGITELDRLHGQVAAAAAQSKQLASDLQARAAKSAADPAAGTKVGAALAEATGDIAKGLPDTAVAVKATTAVLRTFDVGVVGTDEAAAEDVAGE